MTGTNQEEAAGAITQIGLDAIRGETEMCIMAIGMGQLIGRCVGRDKQTGRFVSLTRRTLIGAYTDVEPVELERRPNPRKAPAVAARLVIGVVLAVIAAIAPKAAPAARLAALLLSAGASAAQWGAGYGRREFIHDQWPLVLILAPCWAFLIWLVIR